MSAICSSICRSINFGVTKINQSIDRIKTNPALELKVLQIVINTFQAYDSFYVGKIQEHSFINDLKGSVTIIGFYLSSKNLKYLAQLFSRENLDKKALRQSLELLKDNYPAIEAKDVIGHVMDKQHVYYSQEDVRQKISNYLKEKLNFGEEAAKEIASNVVIQQKAPSQLDYTVRVCKSLLGFRHNYLALSKWGIIDASKISEIAYSIGRRSPIFMIVTSIGIDRVFKVFSYSTDLLALVEAYQRYINQSAKLAKAQTNGDQAKCAKVGLKLTAAKYDMLTGSLGVALTTVSFAVALNPTLLLFLSLTNQGIGLYCAWVSPR